MYFIYNLLLTICFMLYIPVLLVKMIKGELVEVKERLGFLPPDIVKGNKGGTVIWVHGVSVGETVAASPLVAEIKNLYPGCRVVFSTGTNTGQEMARKLINADNFLYFPFDLSWTVKRALSRIQPDLVIIMETELWPNFIKTAHKLGSKVLLANGRISRRSANGYRLLGSFFRKAIKYVDALVMQSQEDLGSILSLGAAKERTFNYGNIKYDLGLKEIDPLLGQKLKKDLQIENSYPILVVGSSHANEEELLIPLFKRLKAEYEDFLMILAPRHPERLSEIQSLYHKAGIPTVRRTELKVKRRTTPVILLDTIGELFYVYSLADLVFIGGSLVSIGGHNILEPAAHGRPVFVGPYMFNFKEIINLFVRHDAVVQVNDIQELEEKMLFSLKNQGELRKKGKKGLEIVRTNQGATKRIINLVAELLG